MTEPLTASASAADRRLRERIIQRVAELPDRTSPDDWPDAMLVTAEELLDILADELAVRDAPPRGAPEGWQDIATAPKDGSRINLIGQHVGTGKWCRDDAEWDLEEGSSWPEMWRWSNVAPSHWKPLDPPPAPRSTGSHETPKC